MENSQLSLIPAELRVSIVYPYANGANAHPVIAASIPNASEAGRRVAAVVFH